MPKDASAERMLLLRVKRERVNLVRLDSLPECVM